jgi:hypothetical protein
MRNHERGNLIVPLTVALFFSLGFLHTAMADFPITGHYEMIGSSLESGSLDILVLSDNKFKFDLEKNKKETDGKVTSSCKIAGYGYFDKNWLVSKIHGSSFYNKDSQCGFNFTFDSNKKVVKVEVKDSPKPDCLFERVFKRTSKKPYTDKKIRKKHCDEATNEVFLAAHPEMSGRTIDKYISDLKKEWNEIRNHIKECKSKKRKKRKLCDKKADEIFSGHHPNMSGKKMSKHKRSLKREWKKIRRSIKGCR